MDFWTKFNKVQETVISFSLHSNDREDHFYSEDVRMTDMVYIGDNLAQLKAHDKPVMIFKVP